MARGFDGLDKPAEGEGEKKEEGAEKKEEGAAGEVGSNEPIATRFLKLCDEEDSRKRLSRWINVDALLPFARESDPCRAVSERCVPPLPDEKTKERSNLTSLASLAMWRTAAVNNDRPSSEAELAEVALKASEAQLSLGFTTTELDRELMEAQDHLAGVSEAVAEAVRADNEDTLSSLVVRRVTLRGLLREQEHRLQGALREQNYEMKREAMLRMVQSGMLPIELKVATLAAAREEEELNELRGESQMLQQLILRIKITTGLRQLRRARVHKRESRDAQARAALDAPLLAEMASSERRQQLLAKRLKETQSDLKQHTAELAALHKARKQKMRATNRLVSYREDHEGEEIARLDDGQLDESLARALKPPQTAEAAAMAAVMAEITPKPSLGPEIIEEAVTATEMADRKKKLRRLEREVAALESALSPRMVAAAKRAASGNASACSSLVASFAGSFSGGIGGVPTGSFTGSLPNSPREYRRPGTSHGAIGGGKTSSFDDDDLPPAPAPTGYPFVEPRPPVRPKQSSPPAHRRSGALTDRSSLRPPPIATGGAYEHLVQEAEHLAPEAAQQRQPLSARPTTTAFVQRPISQPPPALRTAARQCRRPPRVELAQREPRPPHRLHRS